FLFHVCTPLPSYTISLHDALPISHPHGADRFSDLRIDGPSHRLSHRLSVFNELRKKGDGFHHDADQSRGDHRDVYRARDGVVLLRGRNHRQPRDLLGGHGGRAAESLPGNECGSSIYDLLWLQLDDLDTDRPVTYASEEGHHGYTLQRILSSVSGRTIGQRG